MSSYHSSFSYLNKNSSEDMHWLIAHFEADNGETDSYLSQEQVYSDSYNGTRRVLYGTKWNAVASVKITVIKQNLSDFTEAECRDAYRWLTGKPTASYLDLYAGDSLRYSFLGTVQDVKPQKLDARTVGLNIYFESVSPWAWSPQQIISISFEQSLSVVDDGILDATSDGKALSVDTNGILKHNDGSFAITSNGTIYLTNSGSSNSIPLQINNLSDDLYTYITLDTVFKNTNCTQLSINNRTLDEETLITSIVQNETIKLNSNQFITSSSPGKIFGNTFSFKWPRLAPGVNDILVSVDGAGSLEFTYRYPIKIGDCAIDVVMSNGECGCPDNTDYGFISWHDITETPTTVAGYGITDVYTEIEIDNKLNNINIENNASVNEGELNAMLADVLD